MSVGRGPAGAVPAPGAKGETGEGAAVPEGAVLAPVAAGAAAVGAGGRVAPTDGVPAGRSGTVRGGSVISLAGLLTTRRWPGRGSCVTAGASAAGLVAVPSGSPGALGSEIGAGGRAPGRSSAGVLVTRWAAPGVPPCAGAETDLVDAGSSGCTARRRPSRSALRRARSACASSIDDEWLLTPIPRSMQRSRASLLVSPSSRASS